MQTRRRNSQTPSTPDIRNIGKWTTAGSWVSLRGSAEASPPQGMPLQAAASLLQEVLTCACTRAAGCWSTAGTAGLCSPAPCRQQQKQPAAGSHMTVVSGFVTMQRCGCCDVRWAHKVQQSKGLLNTNRCPQEGRSKRAA
jgi:hypothetical protein